MSIPGPGKQGDLNNQSFPLKVGRVHISTSGDDAFQMRAKTRLDESFRARHFVGIEVIEWKFGTTH